MYSFFHQNNVNSFLCDILIIQEYVRTLQAFYPYTRMCIHHKYKRSEKHSTLILSPSIPPPSFFFSTAYSHKQTQNKQTNVNSIHLSSKLANFLFSYNCSYVNQFLISSVVVFFLFFTRRIKFIVSPINTNYIQNKHTVRVSYMCACVRVCMCVCLCASNKHQYKHSHLRRIGVGVVVAVVVIFIFSTWNNDFAHSTQLLIFGCMHILFFRLRPTILLTQWMPVCFHNYSRPKTIWMHLNAIQLMHTIIFIIGDY